MRLFFLIAVFSFLAQVFLPWWSMAIVAFGFSFFLGEKSLQVFFAGFFGCGIVWLLMAVYVYFTKGDLMTNRIAELLSIHSSVFLYAGTFLIAAIVGGMAALAGFLLSDIFLLRKNTTGV